MNTQLFSLILIFGVLILACQRPSQENVSEDSTMQLEEEVIDQNTVNDFLETTGFITKTKTGQIIRESELVNASYSQVSGSLTTLSSNPETDPMTIFFIKVAGSALNDKTGAERFISEHILTDDQYLSDMKRMVGFLQRQDRPVIKEALLNIIDQLSNEQCLDYLTETGYLMSRNPNTYNPSQLKALPIFLRLTLFNKLNGQSGEAQKVANKMKTDLGITS